MKTKHKVILWICLLLVVTIVACVVLIRGFENNQPTSVVPDDSPATLSISATPTSSIVQNTQKYVSESRKFELNFPPSWGEVQITNTDVVGGKATMFSFKTTDSKFSGGVATAVTIYEYLLSTDLKTGIQIAADENYSYSYTTWESAPNDHQQITEKELADVLKTFKLTR